MLVSENATSTCEGLYTLHACVYITYLVRDDDRPVPTSELRSETAIRSEKLVTSDGRPIVLASVGVHTDGASAASS